MYGNDDKKPAKRMGSSSGKTASKPSKRMTKPMNPKTMNLSETYMENKPGSADKARKFFADKKMYTENKPGAADRARKFFADNKTAKMEAVKRMLKAKKG